MSREIKFRVRCEKHERFEYYSLGDLICGAATGSNGEGGIFTAETWSQFTGLHDKHGKEIYEGDVFSAFPFVLNGKEIQVNKHVVEFRDGCFGYLDATSTYFIGFQENKNFMWKENKSLEIEIIGNIHENPALLATPSGQGSSEFLNGKG